MTDCTDKQLGRYALDYFLNKEEMKSILEKVDILWFRLYTDNFAKLNLHSIIPA
jgi:hypothetical protein